MFSRILTALNPFGKKYAQKWGGAEAPSVLFVVENLPVPLDRRVWLEASSLRDKGYRVSVICPKMYECTAAYECFNGIHIYRFPLLFEANGLLGYVLEYGFALTLILWYALRIWLKSGIDVIHVANPPDLLVFIAIPFKLFGTKVIYDQHDLCPELFLAKGKRSQWLNRLLIGLEKLSYRLSNAVVVPNNSYREIALTRGGKSSDSVFLVRNGPLKDALKPNPLVSLQPLIGYVGVMGDQDSVDIILELAARLKPSYPELRYVLLGGGTHKNYYEECARELGVDDIVEFTGMVDEKRIASELAPCYLCVVPDRINEFTSRSTMNKVMEYMALQKPIVQFDNPEGRYSAGEASLYAAVNDVDDFTNKVMQLLDNPAQALQMGKEGRKDFLNKLHWEQSIKVLYQAYDFVLAPENSHISDRRPNDSNYE